MNSVSISINTSIFQAKILPSEGTIVGYAALIHFYDLKMPYPSKIAIIDSKNKKEDTTEYQLFPSIYMPEETLYKHLVFALKYEGLNLLFFKKIFESDINAQIVKFINDEPSSIYARKIWFLYEFLMNKTLDIPDADSKIKYNLIIDESIQFGASNSLNSSRHRIKNNLPGTINFCPLVFKSQKLKNYIEQNLEVQKNNYLNGIRKSILQRAASFLLLNDSKASFSIEGESPKSNRAARWGQAIGQAGHRDISRQELERLQQLVIESKFITMGYRTKGGFIGERDKDTFSPLPDHISAKFQDLEILMEGLIATNQLLLADNIDPIVTASIISFGFVFIHPFIDGNGRIHRYLIHHVLAKKQFSEQGIIFPVSAAILEKIMEYKKILEAFSLPLLDFVDWNETKDHNVHVLNETIDFYRYYDATLQAEFLYECVKDTIEKIIPAEVEYLKKYEEFKNYMDNNIEMSDDMVALIVRFLRQNNGTLSKRAISNEFKALNSNEIIEIEKYYRLIFKDN